MVDFPTRDSKLLAYLKKHPAGASFPDTRIDYFQRFLGVDQFLNLYVHPHVNTGAAANDEQQSVFLTDHGPEHIASVMRRVSELLSPDISRITPYEAYLLLLAIHLHDTGNIFGRMGHERRIQSAMNQLGDRLLGNDGVERRMIRDIATAHGGYVGNDENNKDTIGCLKYEDDEPLARVKLLAALLRFGDELADDYTRTSSYLIEGSPLRDASEVFHQYADRLRRVVVDTKTISLHFDIARSLICRTMKKGGKDGIRDVYLIDEVKDRCLKMHREHIYCSRFLLPLVNITGISVRVVICDASPTDPQGNEYAEEIQRWNFSMKQSGYPDHITSLGEISPEFAELTGLSIQARFTNVASSPTGEPENIGIAQ